MYKMRINGIVIDNNSEFATYQDPDKIPEDLKKFISFWLPQQVSSAQDWLWTTKFVWPDIDRIVHLKRLVNIFYITTKFS